MGAQFLGLTDGSLAKTQRSTHINACLRNKLARDLDRGPAELEYCFLCFSWFVEEEWAEHCQNHLKSIVSKRCASITYCHTLFRPAQCFFCFGENKWSSWTRDNKLYGHLEKHIRETSWPSECPHPLCASRLNDQTSFVYHLYDVHRVRMKAGNPALVTTKSALQPSPEAPGAYGQKWQTEESEGRRIQQLSPKGQETSQGEEQTAELQFTIDQYIRDAFRNGSSHCDSNRATSESADNDCEILPELSHSSSTLSPWLDEPNGRQLTVHEACHADLSWPTASACTPGKEPTIGYNEDVFSLYLRSPSPPEISPEPAKDRNTSEPKFSSKTLSEEIEANRSSGFPSHYTATSSVDGTTQAKKPRLILRMGKPTSKPKARFRLRLNSPQIAGGKRGPVPHSSQSRKKRVRGR